MRRLKNAIANLCHFLCVFRHNGDSKTNENNVMKRTHIVLPDALKARAKECAKKQEQSLAEFIRRAIEAMLEKNGG